MEPQRQSGPQRAFIWEVKDFSSQLWEITPLLRIPDFLHAGAYNCFSPHVLSSCACKNLFCLGCLERQAEFSDEPWQEIRGSWGCRADFYIKASPTSLPLNVAPPAAATQRVSVCCLGATGQTDHGGQTQPHNTWDRCREAHRRAG